MPASRSGSPALLTPTLARLRLPKRSFLPAILADVNTPECIIGRMAISLQPGTIVQVRSGGPIMTVVGEHSSHGVSMGVNCEWFDDKMQVKSAPFAETSLRELSEEEIERRKKWGA